MKIKNNNTIKIQCSSELLASPSKRLLSVTEAGTLVRPAFAQPEKYLTDPCLTLHLDLCWRQ